jgi:alpha-glucosidase
VNSDSDTPWWRGAVIYQVYPRSFCDASGDGIGDLRGCTRRLDHIASLGVDAIWLSPFFTSPMKDFGYDVADYCDVDPIFGSLADFDELLAQAHRRGLRVIIDQVYSHTSDQHPWFQRSRASRDNPKADWYVWRDANPDGTPPTNWQSVFGGSAWQWDARRRQYYLHNFLVSQPDLNVHAPAVQDALLAVTRFWLERGVDGFRLDALNFAMHDPAFRDNPPAEPARRARAGRPFDFQQHLYNQSHPDIPKFLERIRQVTDAFPETFTVAEVVGPEPLDEMKAFTAQGRRLDSAYGFDFLYADRLTPALVRATVEDWPGEPGEGWPSWAFSNHDAPRAVSRWCNDPARHTQYAQLMLMLLLALRGNAFLYQGEELGLPTADVPFEHLKDPEAIENWPATLGRDGVRTPIPWVGEARHAGFSAATPWMPLDPRHAALAVDRQERDPRSTLHFTRALIAVRAGSPALRSGSLLFAPDLPDALADTVIAFERRVDSETICAVFNVGADTVRWKPGAARNDDDVLIGVGFAAEADDEGGDFGRGTCVPQALPGLSGYLARVQSRPE